jgi:hypothetical protein
MDMTDVYTSGIDFFRWVYQCDSTCIDCEEAARFGDFDIVEFLVDLNRKSGICTGLARGGHFDTLVWARSKNCDWNHWTCSAAARGGHLDILKWLVANGCNDRRGSTCSDAAEGGHFDVLVWARENGFNCDK